MDFRKALGRPSGPLEVEALREWSVAKTTDGEKLTVANLQAEGTRDGK